MPSIAQGQKFTNTGSGSLIVGGIVLLFVLGLFFVPEVVQRDPQKMAANQEQQAEQVAPKSQDFLDSVSSDLNLTGEVAKPQAKTRAVPDSVEPQKKKSSSLAAVSTIVEKPVGSQEAPATEDHKEQELREEEAELLRASAPDCDVTTPGGEGKGSGELFPADKPLTWKVLQSGRVKKILKKARRQAHQLIIKFENNHPKSRFALNNYIGGLGRAMSGKGLQATEVPAYLAVLDQSVTDALVREDVPQALRIKWADITLGAHLHSADQFQRKQSIVSPFDPRMRLSKLRIRQGYKKRGKMDPTARVAVKAYGYVQGEHVKKIELYRNGKWVKKLPLEKRTDDAGRRLFRLRQGQNVRDSHFTLKVTDVKDRVYERSYNFYPRVRAFKWNGETDGSFAIPFPEDHPGLDQHFLGGSTRTGRQRGPIGTF